MAKKDDPKLAIRQKANALRQEEQRRQARRKALLQAGIIVGVLAIVGVIVLVMFLNRGGSGGTQPEASATVTVDGNEVPFEIAGTAVRVGDESAPVSIEIYEDFSCPHCQEYEAAVGDTLVELIASGDAVVQFHPIKVVTDYGIRAGSAAACVAVHEPQQWLAAHARLMQGHSGQTDGWRHSDFATFLDGLGAGSSDTLDCVRGGTYTEWVKSNTNAARDLGIASTPTLIVNGERQSELLSPEGLRALVEG